MKILHIIYDDLNNPWCGGGGALRAAKINEVLANQHQITVFTGNYPGACNETKNNVRYVRLGLKCSYLLSRISFTLMLPFMIKACPCDIVVNDCSYFAPCFANFYTKRPCVSIIHHLMEKHSFRLYSVLGIIPFLFEKILINMSLHIITPSAHVRKTLLKRFPYKHIVDIPNGISHKYFKSPPEEKNFILFIGRIDIYMKGLDILIKAFSQLKNKKTKLIIAGHGKPNDQKMLEKLIIDYAVQDRVNWIGRVSERKKMDLLSTCLFFVLPSRFEGWGISAVEANASGKAVVASNINGLKEAVLRNKTAIMFDVNNSQMLSEKMDLLIDNQKIRMALGQNGRIWAGQFSWLTIASKHLDFLKLSIRECLKIKFTYSIHFSGHNMTGKQVSIIIPAYNEAASIGDVIKTIKTKYPNFEIIVVNDASCDNTAEIAEKAGATVFSHPYNIGNGASIKTGMRVASGDIFVTMDGDGQHKAEDIEKLLVEMGTYDMVVGQRIFSGQASLARYLGNLFYNKFASYVTKFKVKDLTSGFRAVNAVMAKRFLYLFPNTYSYPTTLTLSVLRSGRSLKYVPISSHKRQKGKSGINIVKDGVRFFMIIIKICTLFSPLRIFLPVSASLFLLGIFHYLITYLRTGRFTNMSALLLVTSVVVFMMGLVSEQICQMRFERTGDFRIQDTIKNGNDDINDII